MVKRLIVSITVSALLAGGLFLSFAEGVAQTQKPKITQICKQCHQPDEKILRGTLGGISANAETIQINIGPAIWLAKFDENTKLINAEKFSKIPKEKEIAIFVSEKNGVLYAESVSVKPPAKLPDEKLIRLDEMAKLQEKGDFALVDSRPAPRYNEGHIPGAINIYDAEFDKNADKLPKEKDKLLIFYCAGVT